MCCLKSISGRDVKGCTVGKGQCSQRWMYCWGKGHSVQRGEDSASAGFRAAAQSPLRQQKTAEDRRRRQVIRMEGDSDMVSADMMLCGERS